MINDFASAVLALLRSDTSLLRVFDGPPPDKTKAPYVVVYFSTDSEDSDRLTAQTSAANVRIITHCVGDTPQGARVVSARVRAALLDARIPIEYYREHPIRHEYGLPPVADQATGFWVHDAVDGWTTTYQRAT